ncbi:hypothetical protein M1C59_18695 [Gordonia terrae]|uniref:hypothetical protein n=1 Tax=Gordonia terrae TaxID=2055 RepID=UPI00200AF11E|nr:hypothetical protein [Gordonia terrae]UPW08067.1 hypothetical protein M1C59_18695 [Gordonia terrae]
MTGQQHVSTIGALGDTLRDLRRSRDRGVDWLLRRISDSGEPEHSDRHNGYYRLPWTLAYVGHREEAAAVLGWIENNALTENGDLRPGPPRDSWTRVAATYPGSVIAQGAWVLEHYGTATAVLDTLVASFRSDTGGAYWERPENRTDGRQLLFPTAQLGMTALTMGRTDVSDPAIGWFRDLFRGQRRLPTQFFVGQRGGQVIDEVPDTDRYNLVVDFRLPRQAFHNPGIGAAFLARHSIASGNAESAEMARSLLALYDNSTPAMFDYAESTGICKLGLGASVMLELEPGPAALRDLVAMNAWYRDSQNADGSWAPRTFLRPDPQQWHVLEKTAEHVLWISMMITALGAHVRTAQTEEATR